MNSRTFYPTSNQADRPVYVESDGVYAQIMVPGAHRDHIAFESDRCAGGGAPLRALADQLRALADELDQEASRIDAEEDGE